MHWYYYKPGHYPLIDVSKIKRDKVETYYIMYWSTDPSFTSQELPKRRPQWRTVQPRHHSSLREGNAVRWVALMLKCRANACMAWHKSLSHRQSQVINYFIWHNMLASKISINIDKASLVFLVRVRPRSALDFWHQRSMLQDWHVCNSHMIMSEWCGVQ